MTNNLNFRIHPAIGIARIGSSAEFYVAPETAAGDTLTAPSGGLPIKPGTESDTITSSDLRDANGAFKRQAARFKIYQYADGTETYPLGPAACLQEIQIGTTINGIKVKEIVWTVHLANKKALGYQADPDTGGGVDSFNGKLPYPPLRNPNFPMNAKQNDPIRFQALIIDPGPRTISGKATPPVAFDRMTEASYFDGNAPKEIPDYPKTFPVDYFGKNLTEPQGAIDTLGEIRTDENGRLLVTGGYGRSANWDNVPLTGPVDNDNWFDDASDGPVSAVIVLEDDTKMAVQGGSWVCVTDPSFAPQIKNVVSLWEDMYDAWVRNLGLVPDLFDGTSFNSSYKPGFYNQLSGIFQGAELQQWIANLPSDPHGGVGGIIPEIPPKPQKYPYVLNILRNPNNFDQYGDESGSPYMPLALGDNGMSFLVLTQTQYFFVQQWTAGNYNANIPELGPGELLDQNTLLNCLGGRFSPGIDMTWTVRLPEIYIQDWKNSGTGPFRINPQVLNYAQATKSNPFLTEGWVPLQSKIPTGIQPGDISNLMALPWHLDYNSCANHPVDHLTTPIYPNDPPPPGGPDKYSDYSFWSWPAQRPVAAFTSTKAQADKEQWFTLRGPGTDPTKDPADPMPRSGTDAQNVCRYQTISDILTNWQKVGVIIQATSIDGDIATTYDNTWYLEAESQFPDGTPVSSWPNYLPKTP